MLIAKQLCLGGMSGGRGPRMTLLALGSNQPFKHLTGAAILKCAMEQLQSRGLVPIASSHYYISQALQSVRQPAYANAVVAVRSVEPLGKILRDIKQIERDMGRRAGVHWGPRVLDIDIISHRGQMASGQSLGWVDKRGRATVLRRGQLTLPHPEMHRRRFVLQPIVDIMPHWRHPIFNVSAQQLLRRLSRCRQNRVVRLPIDQLDLVCD